MRGTLRKWFADRGYGFVTPTDDPCAAEVFISAARVGQQPGPAVALEAGALLEFDVAADQSGRPAAINVKHVRGVAHCE